MRQNDLFASPDRLHAVDFEPTFEAWRDRARALLAANVPPDAVDWRPSGESIQTGLPTLTASPTVAAMLASSNKTARSQFTVTRAFVSLAQRVANHRDAERWPLLYRVLWRLAHDEPHLLKVEVDNDVHRFQRMAKAVRRDMHKMKAFVRFRRVEDDAGDAWFIAWHRPDHRIVRAVAPFFVERFNDQRWTILTPDASASWDLRELRFGPGAPREAAPAGDALEDLWRTYYASIFNPARVKVKAMKAEMPVRHWATLPEADLIPGLLRDAPTRVDAMVAKPTRPPARQFFPDEPTLETLATALPACRACALCENGTRPVAGVGPADAAIVLVGEQPGDTEERLGLPFVGPAGEVLHRALERVGLPQDDVYLTNTVKHFRFKQSGARRIHRSPGLTEVSACFPWLREELNLLRPRILVCLGATAARALYGTDARLRSDRGKPKATRHAPWTLVTYHPSALLRIPDPAARQQAEHAFHADLELAVEHWRQISTG